MSRNDKKSRADLERELQDLRQEEDQALRQVVMFRIVCKSEGGVF